MKLVLKTVDKIILICWINVIMMANVLSVVSYKIFPAKLGGQKGIALFNKYFSVYHTFFLVTIKANDPSFADYKVMNILSNSKLRYVNPFYFFTIRKIIRSHKITHVIIEHPYYGWLGVLIKWFCGIKLVVHSHNIEALRFKSLHKWWWGILWNYERYVLRKADITFCITEEDRQYMITRFRIKPERLTVITYGIEWNKPPSKDERVEAKKTLQQKHFIKEDEVIYLFNGTLDYQPNLDALKNILDSINPIYLAKGRPYRIIICGKNLPEELQELSGYTDKNIIYAGFVDDISIYFKGSDVFVNPVSDGGGIKTKLVEALGYNLNVVSTTNGAIGVNPACCNGKLLITPDGNWEEFAKAMINAISISHDITPEFFETFYWENIAKKAATLLPT